MSGENITVLLQHVFHAQWSSAVGCKENNEEYLVGTIQCVE